MRNNNYKLLLGALAGAAVAGIATLLFAPKSGKDLREDVGKQADKAVDTAEDYMDIAKDKGSDVMETAQEAGSDLMENRQKTMHQMGKEVGRAADRAEEGLTETAKYDMKQAADTHKQARERTKEIAKETAEDVIDTAEEAKQEAENQ